MRKPLLQRLRRKRPDMDWTDIGKVVAPFAPTLGGLIGGLIPFPGAGLAGQALGNIIARQFGVEPTPEAVNAAIKNNPNEVVLAKLRAATEEAKAQWPAIAAIEAAREKTTQIETSEVAETMRSELAAPPGEHWFYRGWRPAAGWIFDVLCALYGIIGAACLVALLFGHPDAWHEFTAAWSAILATLAPPALVVGVNVLGRSQEKIKAMDVTSVANPVPTLPAPKIIKR